MDEKPAQAMRRGKGSSLWNAIESVNAGLERPAIVASWPTFKGHTAVLDVGANIGSDAEQLVEFAIMGEAFQSA
ncbi:PlsX Fatty acid/phospholipid biosynthesis enzyme, partial [Pyrenophora tritici-repentis]